VVDKKETTLGRTAFRIEHWREQVAQQERSGLSVKQYCEAHKVTEQSFYVWRKRLQKQPPMRFALVETTLGERQPAGDTGLELILARGERLRIGCGVDAGYPRQDYGSTSAGLWILSQITQDHSERPCQPFAQCGHDRTFIHGRAPEAQDLTASQSRSSAVRHHSYLHIRNGDHPTVHHAFEHGKDLLCLLWTLHYRNHDRLITTE
jgi:hypothetical protein